MKVLAEYCIQDALLPLRIVNKRNTMTNLIEMAKVVYVPITYLMIRGQQIRIFSLLTKMARENNFLVPYPTKMSDDEAGYQGATVLTATKGSYDDPIDGLDFASLYPGIMMDNNLCYSSLVKDEEYLDIDGVGYLTVCVDGTDYTFAQTDIGLLPKILKYLLGSRKKAKREMATATTELARSIANGKQLAYKVTCNSVYGFTGAINGMLPCKPIAAAVTTIGRKMIKDSKEYAENASNFPLIPNYKCTVVYGDTDSIYCNFHVSKDIPHIDRVQRSMEIGVEVSSEITKFLRNQLVHRLPAEKWVELEFEKIYYPFLQFAKKRYVGPVYMEHDGIMKKDKVDAKGIVLTRRDNCPLLKKVYRECLDQLIDIDLTKSERIIESVKVLKRNIRDMFAGKMDMDMFTLSKSLRNEYNSKTKGPMSFDEILDPSTLESDLVGISQSHVRLARKMYARDSGSAPRPGDRVKYVFVYPSKSNERKKDHLQWELTEHPDYVKENNVELNYLYYFDKQLTLPLISLFEIHIKDAAMLMKSLRGEYVNKKNKQSTLSFGTSKSTRPNEWYTEPIGVYETKKKRKYEQMSITGFFT